MKNRNDLAALGSRIAHKSLKSSVDEKFKHADHALGIENEVNKIRDKVIRKSYALTKQDIDRIKHIKDKCLNKKIVLNDSHIIRVALMLASNLNEDVLINASIEVPRLVMGRPKMK